MTNTKTSLHLLQSSFGIEVDNIEDITSELITKYKVVLVRDVPKDKELVTSVCAKLGKIWNTSVGSHTNKHAIDDKIELLGTDGLWGNRELRWHMDVPYRDRIGLPARAMYMLETQGFGDTYWCDLETVAASLEPELKDRLRHIQFKFSQSYNKNPVSLYRNVLEYNPYTGNEVLRIDELFCDPEEHVELYNELMRRATSHDFVYRHHWREGDFIIWDNTSTMHKRDKVPDDKRRNAWKLTLTLSR